MFMEKRLFLSVLFLNFCLHAKSTEESIKKFVDTIMGCAKDFPISADDLEQLKNKLMPDNENIKCLFACAYKASDVMDDQGKLSVEGINNQARIYLSKDAEKLAKAKEFTDACKSVNDVEVADGSKGCERAALIFKCSVDKASQFGFGL